MKPYNEQLALEKAVNRQGFTKDELIDARKAIAKANSELSSGKT